MSFPISFVYTCSLTFVQRTSVTCKKSSLGEFPSGRCSGRRPRAPHPGRCSTAPLRVPGWLAARLAEAGPKPTPSLHGEPLCKASPAPGQRPGPLLCPGVLLSPASGSRQGGPQQTSSGKEGAPLGSLVLNKRLEIRQNQHGCRHRLDQRKACWVGVLPCWAPNPHFLCHLPTPPPTILLSAASPSLEHPPPSC